MNRQLLPIFMATASLANATTVAWTANGTVSSATGVYSADGIVADTPVEIEMKYDDQAGHTITKELPFFSVEEIDYWNSIDLSTSITIGDQTWKGSVHTAPDDNGFRTLFLKLDGKEGASESITATIQDDDGGSFEFFPLEVEAENSLIQLLFSSTDNNFLSNSVAENSLDENLITSATGFLQSGSSNKITFDLDPASIVIENEVLPPPTPVIGLLRTNDNLELFWQSAFDVNYQVQSSLTMEEGSWSDFGSTKFGNGGTLNQNVAIVPGFKIFYRVVATPAPEL